MVDVILPLLPLSVAVKFRIMKQRPNFLLARVYCYFQHVRRQDTDKSLRGHNVTVDVSPTIATKTF